MKLSQIFSQLTHGELSQISLGGASTGGISEENYPALVDHINLAMAALHSRFSLKEGSVVLELVPGQYDYPLPAECLKVLTVATETGVELVLNRKGDSFACSTPSASVLTVPAPLVDKPLWLASDIKTDSLTVVYRRLPAPIEIDDFGIDPAEVEVDLPMTHLQALLLFVASRVFSASSLSDQPLNYNSFFSRYEHECQVLEAAGMRLDYAGQENRLRRGGWV